MPQQSGTTSLLKTVGLLVVCFGSALAGMIVREQKTIQEPTPALERLVASREAQPIPEEDYFSELVKLLREEFYEPVGDEMKLATGAVKGMVGSLNDLHSVYYDKDEFPAVARAMQGRYEGIGADLAFEYPPAKKGEVGSRIPRLVVSSVVPNGPAARAGILAGDWVEEIDGHWVLNSAFLDHAREVQQKVQSNRLPASALDQVRVELNRKLDDAIPPMRGWKRLALGKSGTVAVTLHRGGELVKTNVVKAMVDRPLAPSHVRFAFLPGNEKKADPSQLKKIDLRGSRGGDYATMLAVLKKLGVSGSFGSLRKDGEKTGEPLAIKGAPKPAKDVSILVDKDTRGVAEIFAVVMKQAGARVSGTSSGKLVATEVHVLPDGSGYTLRVGTFVPRGAK